MLNTARLGYIEDLSRKCVKFLTPFFVKKCPDKISPGTVLKDFHIFYHWIPERTHQ